MLIVDDDPDVRKRVRSGLEKLGLDVLEAANGKAALALLLEGGQTPALICLEPVLPELSGYEMCECIRAVRRLAQVPILMICARSTPADRALAEEVGANAYLTKPIRWDGFFAIVTDLLEKSEELQSASPMPGEPANTQEIPGANAPGLHKQEVPRDRRGEHT